MDNSEKKNNSSTVIVVIIACILMGVVVNFMHSPDTNFIQDFLLWVGGSVVLIALWLFIAHTLEKGNK